MNILSKKELSIKHGLHIRTICYHLKINKGLKGYLVKMGKFIYKGKKYDLPKRLDKRTRLVFIEEEVEDYFNYNYFKENESESNNF